MHGYGRPRRGNLVGESELGWTHLFLAGLGSGLGHLAGGLGLLDGLDDTDGNGLSHVTDGEATEGWVLGESLDAHGLEIEALENVNFNLGRNLFMKILDYLGGDHVDDGGITRLDLLGEVLHRQHGPLQGNLEFS